MAHLQHIPGDPRLVDQLVYELKSKGIFDQFRKECIADVDTRPAYQNLRQRVENSVTTFLSRQCWQPELNKNQLREKLRKHILDGNYLEQGVERIVDQVVNPKVASVFIPQVEDLAYNYLGITRKKSTTNAETSKDKSDSDSLLPTDLEAVSPGSVKSNDDKNDVEMDTSETKIEIKMDVDDEKPKDNTVIVEKQEENSKINTDVILQENYTIDKSTIPLPAEGIKLDSIPHPKNSPPKIEESQIELENIELPKIIKEPVLSDIPLPDEIPKQDKNDYFKPNTDEDDSSSDSSLRRNMSPLTPVRNFDTDNSCDAQQAFDNDLTNNKDAEPSSFRFSIEAKSSENSSDGTKAEKKDEEQLSYQFNNQVNINTFNTPTYEESSNSNILHIDYESDANSKVVNTDSKLDAEPNAEDTKKEKKPEEKRYSHKSSHRSRDSHRHSSSKDKRSDSKHSTSRDSSRHDKKSSAKDDKSKSNTKDSTKDRSDKKESGDSSRHKSSHKSSSKDKDSKSHKSSSSSRHSSKTEDKKSSSTSSSRDKEKEKSSDKNSKEKSSRDSRSSSSYRSSKDDRRKSTSSSSSKKQNDKEKEKKGKNETDDHYSLSGRGNHTRRSTDRDSNDGSSSSKGSHNVSSAKSTSSKKETKSSSSKSGTTSTSSETSPSDKDKTSINAAARNMQPVVRIENHLEMPFASPPRLPFVPDVTMKKPKIAENMQEAKKLIKMRKFLEDEQKRMNQEAALLLEFQANVRPSLSQVYSSIPGPELEFACMMNSGEPKSIIVNNTKIQNEKETKVEHDNESIESKDVETRVVSESVISNTDQDDQDDILKFEELTVEQQLENIYAASYGEEENDNNKNIELATKINNTISENDTTGESSADISFVSIDSQIMDKDELENILDGTNNKDNCEFSIIISECSQDEYSTIEEDSIKISGEIPFRYFTKTDKFHSELLRNRFAKFLKSYIKKSTRKMFLINCDPYNENVLKEVSKCEGNYEIINCIKNGHSKGPKNTKNVVKNVNVAKEIVLPLDTDENIETERNIIFSPIKSECSFELSSDYETKIDDMVHTTSRQEIMEIILGNVEESPSKMPEINYYDDNPSDIDNPLKRKIADIDTTINNNEDAVNTPNKMRKISESDQISSTTEDPGHTLAQPKTINNTRSKFFMKARRVGLPKPKRTDIPNSPCSDKSVENYEQNTSKLPTPNGKIRSVPRTKIQRYDTSDLYKPKLHYLSRRNNIT